MRQATRWLIAVTMPFACLLPGLGAAAEEIAVGAGESVQAAIDRAPEGATITLAPGTFPECITIAKPLTMQGAGWEKTTLGPNKLMPLSQERKDELIAMLNMTQEQQDEFFALLDGTSDQSDCATNARAVMALAATPTVTVKNTMGVVLRGIKFRGPPIGHPDGGYQQSLVTFDNAAGVSRECAVIGPFVNGVAVLPASELRIENSLVAAMWGTGVAASPRTKLHMSHSVVRNCYYAGITLHTTDATIERCRISGAAWHGVRYDDCSPKILSNHIFANARCGIYASGRTSATVRGNVFWRNESTGMSCWFDNRDNVEANTMVGNLHAGISVLGSSKTNVVRNVFVDNPVGVLCDKILSPEGELAESSSGNPKVVKNFFFHNSTPMRDGEAAKPLPMGNESSDPKLTGVGGSFRLAANSPARQANAGAADPIDFADPFAIQPEEKSMIPDSETRDYSKWKKPTVIKTRPQ